MIVVPASMGTIAGIAAGIEDNLVLRAAGVTLKEWRPLVLVPRESPLSAIHLENLLRLARLGVRVIPPLPAFYLRPVTVADVVRSARSTTTPGLGYHRSPFAACVLRAAATARRAAVGARYMPRTVPLRSGGGHRGAGGPDYWAPCRSAHSMRRSSRRRSICAVVSCSSSQRLMALALICCSW